MNILRRAIFWLLSRLSPYPNNSAGWRSVAVSIVNATRKS